MKSLGEKIKTIPESKDIYIRKVAPCFEIDKALSSKIETSERQLIGEQVIKLAH